MRRCLVRTLLVLTAIAASAGTFAVPSCACSPEEITAIVERTGQRLRQLSSETQPRVQARMRQLGERQGWMAGEIEEKAYAFVNDEETQRFDEQAGSLLVRLDTLSQEAASCERKNELEKAAGQLIEVTAAKAAHITARLDAELRKSPPAAKAETSAAVAAPPTQPTPPAQKSEPRPETKRADAARPDPAPKPPARPAQPAPSPAAPAWKTETTQAPSPTADSPPRAIDLADAEFTEEDIRAAGRGFFGTISAGLASVLEYAFKSYGRPTGYILGNEGGGAFLAGLRYGDGTLVTKRAGERKVYWQGPSVGYDFGVAGSRVMFLVYNLRDGEELFTRFAGIDGSAYLVGGVGVTFLKKSRLILAPIRSGVGLRLGANIGYLKFTPTPSLNPF